MSHPLRIPDAFAQFSFDPRENFDGDNAADAAAVAGEQFALAAGFLKFVLVAHGARLGPDHAMRVLSVGRYGRGLSGLVSLWPNSPNSRCQKVGGGWGRGL